MAKTESTMLPLGTIAPPFSLPDTEGHLVSLEDAHDKKAVLVMFICNHCPYVVHVAGELARLGRDYLARGVAVFAINANDAVAYPDDSPARMAEEVEKRGYPFPYLFDETQAVAAAYHAACTPDFFLFDETRRLVYRGQLDDSRPGNGKPNDGRDLRAALDALLEGRAVEGAQKPSLGCNIKWKARD
ncbi:MAG: thioredoxin family protein [Deltaproteobacteria bacterium]|nr:thioredoxin family protein [Deltaproteobacteria bacterium]